MKLILILLAILLTPFLLLSGLGRADLWHTDFFWRGRASLAFLLIFTGSAHFWATEPMTRMLPSWVPMRAGLVYFTGLMELAAVVGLLLPPFSRFTAWCVIALLVSVFPANIYAAVQRIDLAGQGAGPIYLAIRLPVQCFLIWWTWWFGTH